MKPQETLERATEAYKAYYKANKKHLAYANVKETLSAMKDKIAMLENQEHQANEQ